MVWVVSLHFQVSTTNIQNTSMSKIPTTAHIVHVCAATVFLFLLSFLKSAVGSEFVAKEGWSFGQGFGVFSDTLASTWFSCASLCDRHEDCVSFEYSEVVLEERHCRLSNRYVNQTSYAAGDLQGGGRRVYELVSISAHRTFAGKIDTN